SYTALVVLYSSCASNDTATTEIYTLSLHDALPIWDFDKDGVWSVVSGNAKVDKNLFNPYGLELGTYTFMYSLTDDYCNSETLVRSEEHTSELQSRENLVCRLLLEKKKKEYVNATIT